MAGHEEPRRVAFVVLATRSYVWNLARGRRDRCRVIEARRTMRDPKTTPHPGDRFRCKNGTELEATGAVISVSKAGGHTPCLYVSRIIDGKVVSRGVSTVGVFKSSIRSASILAHGSDVDPWVNAERRPHSEF
jgi:hypothetical protein